MQDPSLGSNLPSGGSAADSRVARAIARLRPDSLSHFSYVILLYLVVSLGGNALIRTPAVADIIWPANGLLLAFLLRLPRRSWTVYLAGSIVANVIAHSYFHFLVSQSFLFSVGNTIEVLVAALLLANRDGSKPDLAKLSALVRFVFYGVLLAPLASSAFIELVAIIERI